MQFHERLAPLGPLAEGRVKGQPGEFPLEVDLLIRPVGRVMQHGVGVVEYVALGDGGIAVVFLKLPQAPVGQVVLPVALLVVTVER